MARSTMCGMPRPPCSLCVARRAAGHAAVALNVMSGGLRRPGIVSMPALI